MIETVHNGQPNHQIGQRTRVDPRRVQANTMQTAMIRLYDKPSCCRMTIEAPISRAKAMEEILAGLCASKEGEPNWEAALFMHWAGYDRYRIAAPLEKQHLTHIQLSYSIGAQRVEYVFPGGLLPGECDDLCWQLNDDLGKAQKREWLVTSTLAGMLHGDGVSLADYAVVFARGKTARDGDIVVESATPPTTLYTAVYDLGWSTTAAWLRNIHTTLKQGLDAIREGHAVWVPASTTRQPWEPLIFRPRQDHLRLSLALKPPPTPESVWRLRFPPLSVPIGCPIKMRNGRLRCRTANGGDGLRLISKFGSVDLSPATDGWHTTVG